MPAKVLPIYQSGFDAGDEPLYKKEIEDALILVKELECILR